MCYCYLELAKKSSLNKKKLILILILYLYYIYYSISIGSPVLGADNNGWTPRVAAEKTSHMDVANFLSNQERFADR